MLSDLFFASAMFAIIYLFIDSIIIDSKTKAKFKAGENKGLLALLNDDEFRKRQGDKPPL